METETVRGFASLFGGHGGALFDSDRARCVWQRVTLETFRRHLVGTQAIGTYPVRPDDTCRWGCIDIDEDNFDLGLMVWQCWDWNGVPAWLEKSRSKGWHVWVLTNKWIPAKTMREAGLWVAYLCGLEDIEVNPKNESAKATRTGLVNTVRLPYPGNANPGRMVMIDAERQNPTKTFKVEVFVSRALREVASEDRLGLLQGKYQQRRKEIVRPLPSKGPNQTNSYRPPLVNNREYAYQEAALIVNGLATAEVGQRDNQLYTVANYLKSREWGYEEAKYRMTKVWNESVEDNHTYPLENALEKVDRVYGYA